jgi:Predicted membrane protein (DUF2306)
MRWGFWACAIIAVAVVLRRVLALGYPPRSGPPQLRALDAFFAAHPALTLAHILPALAFVVLCPAIIFRPPGKAVWLERLFFPLGCIVGVTAIAMSTAPVGGWTERSAVLLFDSLFLFSLLRSYQYWRKPDLLLHRRWTLRAIAILLGIATTRPVMGVFSPQLASLTLRPVSFSESLFGSDFPSIPW